MGFHLYASHVVQIRSQYFTPIFYPALTLLELQSRFEDNPVKLKLKQLPLAAAAEQR